MKDIAATRSSTNPTYLDVIVRYEKTYRERLKYSFALGISVKASQWSIVMQSLKRENLKEFVDLLTNFIHDILDEPMPDKCRDNHIEKGLSQMDSNKCLLDASIEQATPQDNHIAECFEEFKEQRKIWAEYLGGCGHTPPGKMTKCAQKVKAVGCK